jgi:hypothetical protein
VLIPSLATFLDVDWNEKGPVVVDWMLEDFRMLSDPAYWWDSPFVLTYSHCLAWVLRKMNLDRVLVDVSCGICTNSNGDFGPRDVPTYADIDMVIAPTHLGHREVGHWALIVIDKHKRSVTVTSSLGTVHRVPEAYSAHYNKILNKTGWVEPNLVRRRNPPHATRTRTRQVVSDNDWYLDFRGVEGTGPRCGQVMCTAFRDQVAVLVAGTAAANVRDSVLGRDLVPSDEFVGDNDAFRAFHHMGAILSTMAMVADIELCPSDVSVLTSSLYNMRGGLFETLMENPECHCGDLCDLALRPLVAKPCCNRRHHVGCFVNEMETKESSNGFGVPAVCSFCVNVYEEIIFIPQSYLPLAVPVVAHPILQRGVTVPEDRSATLRLRNNLMRELKDLAPGPENYQVLDLTETGTPSRSPGPANPADLSSPASPGPANPVAAVLEPEVESDGASVRASASRAPRNIAPSDDDDDDDDDRLHGEQVAAEEQRQDKTEVAARVENNSRDDEATRSAETERKRKMRITQTNERTLRKKAAAEKDAREEREVLAAEALDRDRVAAVAAQAEVEREAVRDAEVVRDAQRKAQRRADEEAQDQENEARVAETDRQDEEELKARSESRRGRLRKLVRSAAPEEGTALEIAQRRRLAEQAKAAARGEALSNQRLAESAVGRAQVELELRGLNREVHGGVPSSVDMCDLGDQSTLASQGGQPQLHQQSQETVGADESGGNAFGDESEASVPSVAEPVAVLPEVRVVLYSEIGAVGEKMGSRVWVFKFGCMAFAAIGDNAAAGLAVHQQLTRLFVEPAPLHLECPVCGAVAPSAVVYYWHMLSGCSDVNTPFEELWHASLPLFFLVTGDVLKSMAYAEQHRGQPVDLLDPRKMPSQVGLNVAHRSKMHCTELCKERSLMISIKKKHLWGVVQKKLYWMGLNANSRNSMVANMPELLCFAFLKPTAEWPPEVLVEGAQEPLRVVAMDEAMDDAA